MGFTVPLGQVRVAHKVAKNIVQVMLTMQARLRVCRLYCTYKDSMQGILRAGLIQPHSATPLHYSPRLTDLSPITLKTLHIYNTLSHQG